MMLSIWYFLQRQTLGVENRPVVARNRDFGEGLMTKEQEGIWEVREPPFCSV